jgi:hypothetical protein
MQAVSSRGYWLAGLIDASYMLRYMLATGWYFNQANDPTPLLTIDTLTVAIGRRYLT